MATRSTISVVDTEGKVHQVYAHWDGYLSCNGKILLNHYNTLESALELVSFGDISSLAEKCIPDADKEHYFDNPQEDVTTYYGRDRGEDGVEVKIYDNVEDYYFKLRREEYDYLFMDGKWHLLQGKTLIEITEEMVEIDSYEALDEMLSNVHSKYLIP